MEVYFFKRTITVALATQEGNISYRRRWSRVEDSIHLVDPLVLRPSLIDNDSLEPDDSSY